MQYMASAIIDSKIYNAVMYAVIVEQPNFQKPSDITYIPVANTLTVMMNHGYAGFDYDETKADCEKLDARLREFYEDKSYVINTDFPTDQSNVTYDDKKEEANTNGAGDVGNSGYGGVEQLIWTKIGEIYRFWQVGEQTQEQQNVIIIYGIMPQ